MERPSETRILPKTRGHVMTDDWTGRTFIRMGESEEIEGRGQQEIRRGCRSSPVADFKDPDATKIEGRSRCLVESAS